jgi:hypothetical protein
MVNCFPNYSIKKAIQIIIDHKYDLYIKDLVIQLLENYVNMIDNTIDNDLLNIIRKHLIHN